jgi:phage terminase large subunit
MPREPVAKYKLTEQEAKARDFWRANPIEAVKDWFDVTPDDWQGDTLNGLLGADSKFDRVAVKSAHGPGKTAVEAWAGWLFLNTCEDSRVVATAPTMAQLGDILWPEYAKWHAKMMPKLANQWLISGGHIRHVSKPKLWFAVARTSNRSANLQGFHGSHILIQCDEASGVPEEVFEVIEGALSEAGEDDKVAKLMLAGNPNFTTGELFHAFNRNRELYHRLTVTGDPKLLERLELEQGAYSRLHGNVYFSKRVKKKYRETIARKYGETGAVFDVRVAGLFPRHDDSSVIPLEWAERARGKTLPVFDNRADPVTIVLDPAREGGNESVVGSFRRGIPVKPFVYRPKTTSSQSADMVEEEVKYWTALGVEIERIVVDEPGVGGGPIDELRKRGYTVTAYNGGVSMKQNIDPEDEVRMFKNVRARDYWLVRRRLELDNLPLPDDEILTAQLASLKFKYVSEKIVIESKQDLTARLGKEASPDRADVIVMGCAPYRSLQGASNSGITEDDIIAGEDRPQMDLDL